MKVLIVTDCFLPRWDGVARFLLSLINALHNSFTLTIAAPDFPGAAPKLPKNVRVVRFPLMKFRLGDIYFAKPQKKKLQKLIRETDVVFTQTIGPLGIKGVCYARKLKKPVLSFIHSIEWELVAKSLRYARKFAFFLVKRIARNIYNKSQLLLCPSKEVAHLLTTTGITTDKKVVSLGIDVHSFEPAESKGVAKSRLELNPKSIIIGYHGRIAREKNLPTLVRAFALVKRLHKNTELLIVGSGVSGQVPQAEDIHLVGAQNNVVPYLQAMDIYVMPSLLETTSLSTLEAMSCGLPVVTTPVGRIAEYVRDRVNGLIFARKDYHKLKERLLRLIRSEELRESLGTAARRTVIQQFNFDKTSQRVAQILTEFAR